MAILPTDIQILFTNYDIIAYFLNLASCSEHFISIKHRILATFKINKKFQIAKKLFQKIHKQLRDRPFNLKGEGGVRVFCFVQKLFFGQHKSQNIFFFCRAMREFVFHILTLGYMTKTLNHFFFLNQNQNIFFSNIGNQNIFFRKKNITPPPFKLNGRSLNRM